MTRDPIHDEDSDLTQEKYPDRFPGENRPLKELMDRSGRRRRAQIQARRWRHIKLFGKWRKISHWVYPYLKVDWLSLFNGLLSMAVIMIMIEPQAVISSKLEWPIVILFLFNGYRFARSV